MALAAYNVGFNHIKDARQIVEWQGGDVASVDDPSKLPSVDNVNVIRSSKSGHLSKCDALDIGLAAVRLGAGRAQKGDEIDPAVGIMVMAKVTTVMETTTTTASLDPVLDTVQVVEWAAAWAVGWTTASMLVN